MGQEETYREKERFFRFRLELFDAPGRYLPVSLVLVAMGKDTPIHQWMI